ncbi:pilus assembly protein [Modicisalibacter radicis]|uniref:pilus assembly protein n=1 Tax=Halomonas sp. EAR18 TaxID=2518972 RepID=UPI001443A50B|nr:PilC/PilY family type IV pilus protein [Halomonas sp. EAR18]
MIVLGHMLSAPAWAGYPFPWIDTGEDEDRGDGASDKEQGDQDGQDDSGQVPDEGEGDESTDNGESGSDSGTGGGGSGGDGGTTAGDEEVVEEYPEVPYQTPPNAQADVVPQSMIVMSNDHQLFFKAYTDWNDIDGDGVIDDTYKKAIRYYGYFDSASCYDYDASLAGGAFKISSDAKDDYTCPGNSEWSGNFLNWVSMTRMDVVRKVLYGGKRHRDNASDTTLLERAYLPYDAHSFVKVVRDNQILNKNTPYNGKGSVSFCNTTGYSGTGQSKSVDKPPLLRIAAGEWPNWAANERWQCIWRNERSEGYQDKRPAVGESSTELKVRVEVCRDAGNGCRRYPDSDYPKPIGLLHEYADSIDFGLMSGSYAYNLSGGVLRANMRSFNEEVDANTGVFESSVAGIVSNLDAFRISRYSYSDGTYNDDECPFGKKLSDIGGGDCSSWGNPLAEITAEALRYMTGASEPSKDFSVGTSTGADDYVEGDFVEWLTSPAWDNDGEANWCAAHAMILMNSSEVSFDSDQLGVLSLLDGGSVKAWTNQVASEEGIQGHYFIGETQSNTDGLCTAKTIGSNTFGEAKGICPGAPGLKGSYNVAGLAKYAHEKSVIRSPDGTEGSSVDTYAVRLSVNTPIIDLGRVKIVPACENVTDGGKCAIVDFRPTSIGDDSGEFEITWEVAEFGGDYDSDIELDFSYVLNDGRLTITTDVTDDSSSRRTGVGYILSGTSGRYDPNNPNRIIDLTSDGFVAHSGIDGYSGSLCNNCVAGNAATSQSYRVSASSGASTLEPPLYYAAKYGNAKGLDAYFEVNRVDELAGALRDVLDQVLRSSNRTGAGLGHSANVDNYVFQTLYNNQISWSGDLVALKTSSSGVDDSDYEWSAREELPAPADRTVITFDASSGSGVPFASTELPDGLPEAGNLVAYLRGDSAQEQRKGGNYRDRLWPPGKDPAPLGDIIDSKPFVVGKPDSYYVPSSAEDIGYLTFVNNHRSRQAMVYVGANDGMLHGFAADTGVERLAYVPGMLLDDLPELASPDYVHRFYVDGSPTVLDACWGTGNNCNWHSVLASGLGAGGRGLFALDVTDPKTFSETNADDLALFEYSPSIEQALFGPRGGRGEGGEDEGEGGSVTGEALHLGHVYGRPSIVQLENRKYAVVFGNGYFSPSDKAALYIIYLDGVADGSISMDDVVRLVPQASANGGQNGLSTVSLVDRDEDGRMDVAYGGDLQGNLWRFDLSSDDDSQWQNNITRLFAAKQSGTNQVITTAVDVGRHPEGGLMVFFGTGSRPGRSLQTSQGRGVGDSFYAIRDKGGSASNASPLTRGDLQERSLATSTEGSSTLRYFSSISGGTLMPEWGWYMDFPDDERVIDTPVLYGEDIIFSSLIPGQGMCGAEDSGYLYELSAFDGMPPASPALDVNGDGLLNDDDRVDDAGGHENVVPVGVKTQGALYTPVIDTNLEANTENKISVSTGAQTQTFQGPPLNPLKLGRASWRELEN